jgi:hypothetical protein
MTIILVRAAGGVNNSPILSPILELGMEAHEHWATMPDNPDIGVGTTVEYYIEGLCNSICWSICWSNFRLTKWCRTFGVGLDIPPTPKGRGNPNGYTFHLPSNPVYERGVWYGRKYLRCHLTRQVVIKLSLHWLSHITRDCGSSKLVNKTLHSTVAQHCFAKLLYT